MNRIGFSKQRALAFFFAACWLLLLTGSPAPTPISIDFPEKIVSATDSPAAHFYSNFPEAADEEFDFEWLEELEDDDKHDSSSDGLRQQQIPVPHAQNLGFVLLSSKPAGIGSIPLYLLFCQLKAHTA